jgi:TRAP-type C4-dicarboxylate transport system permease small subunit
VLFCVSTIAEYDYKFEKSSAIDSEMHEPVYYCYISNDLILGEYRRLIVLIVSSLILMIAMTVFGIALVYQIRKKITFRRQTVHVPNSPLNYLNIVVCWCTLIYIVFSIPRSIIDRYNVYQWISNNDMEIQNIERFINIISCITIINHVAYALNIPFTLIIFLCLNRNIRVKFVRRFRKATSKHKRRQISIVDQVNLSVTLDRSHGKE